MNNRNPFNIPNGSKILKETQNKVNIAYTIPDDIWVYSQDGVKTRLKDLLGIGDTLYVTSTVVHDGTDAGAKRLLDRSIFEHIQRFVHGIDNASANTNVYGELVRAIRRQGLIATKGAMTGFDVVPGLRAAIQTEYSGKITTRGGQVKQVGLATPLPYAIDTPGKLNPNNLKELFMGYLEGNSAGAMRVFMSPLVMKLQERDVDRDALFVLEAAVNGKPVRAFTQKFPYLVEGKFNYLINDTERAIADTVQGFRAFDPNVSNTRKNLVDVLSRNMALIELAKDPSRYAEKVKEGLPAVDLVGRVTNKMNTMASYETSAKLMAQYAYAKAEGRINDDGLGKHFTAKTLIHAVETNSVNQIAKARAILDDSRQGFMINLEQIIKTVISRKENRDYDSIAEVLNSTLTIGGDNKTFAQGKEMKRKHIDTGFIQRIMDNMEYDPEQLIRSFMGMDVDYLTGSETIQNLIDKGQTIEPRPMAIGGDVFEMLTEQIFQSEGNSRGLLNLRPVAGGYLANELFPGSVANPNEMNSYLIDAYQPVVGGPDIRKKVGAGSISAKTNMVKPRNMTSAGVNGYGVERMLLINPVVDSETGEIVTLDNFKERLNQEIGDLLTREEKTIDIDGSEKVSYRKFGELSGSFDLEKLKGNSRLIKDIERKVGVEEGTFGTLLRIDSRDPSGANLKEIRAMVFKYDMIKSRNSSKIYEGIQKVIAEQSTEVAVQRLPNGEIDPIGARAGALNVFVRTNGGKPEQRSMEAAYALMNQGLSVNLQFKASDDNGNMLMTTMIAPDGSNMPMATLLERRLRGDRSVRIQDIYKNYIPYSDSKRALKPMKYNASSVPIELTIGVMELDENNMQKYYAEIAKEIEQSGLRPGFSYEPGEMIGLYSKSGSQKSLDNLLESGVHPNLSPIFDEEKGFIHEFVSSNGAVVYSNDPNIDLNPILFGEHFTRIVGADTNADITYSGGNIDMLIGAGELREKKTEINVMHAAIEQTLGSEGYLAFRESFDGAATPEAKAEILVDTFNKVVPKHKVSVGIAGGIEGTATVIKMSLAQAMTSTDIAGSVLEKDPQMRLGGQPLMSTITDMEKISNNTLDATDIFESGIDDFTKTLMSQGAKVGEGTPTLEPKIPPLSSNVIKKAGRKVREGSVGQSSAAKQARILGILKGLLGKGP